MTLNLFPTSTNVAWPVNKSANWATRVQRSVSGRELRAQDYFSPIYVFTLVFELLRDGWDQRMSRGFAVASFDEMRQILNFYNQQMGPTVPFRYYDPSDNTTRSVAATPAFGSIAFGDGTTTAFQMISPLMAPVIPNVITTVDVGGTPTVAYTIDSNTGLITFSSAPGSGVAVTADFTYYYKVRFSSDSLELENFVWQRWGIKQLKFQSVYE